MTIDVPIYPAAMPASLAELSEIILADPTLSLRQQKEIASALKSLAKAIGCPMQAISAQPTELRKAFKDRNSVSARVSEGRWRNIRSLTQCALGRVGLCKVPARFAQPLSAPWAILIKALSNSGDRYKLAHFGRYCDMAGLTPEQIDDAVMSTFLDDLLLRSLAAEPERTHRDAIISWNRSVAACQIWPQTPLTVPDNRRNYALPWDTFPATLKADADAWLYHLSDEDVFAEADFDPLRPASLITRKKQIHEYISALVLQGEAAEDLCTLADVVTLDRMKKGLKFFWDRAGGKASLHGGQIASVVRSIAKHWVKLDEPELDRLRVISRKIMPAPTGMTPANRTRLRPLLDEETKIRLLNLPERMRAEIVRRGAPTRSLALELQTAVAIEVLIMMPLRIKNLNHLKIGVDLLRGRDKGWTIAIPEEDVKNGMPLEALLPAPTARLIDLYLEKYWPLLADPNTAWLFPGQDPRKPKCQDALRQQIQKSIWVRCGLRFNPHTFRHSAGLIILIDDPGAHGQVQRVVGHKTILTTVSTYSGMETLASIGHYDELIQRMRGDLPTRKDSADRPRRTRR